MFKPENHSDEALLRAFRNGSKHAFEEIFNRYWYPLYKIAYSKLRSHETAEEIVQEVFTAIWHNRKTLNILNLSHYLSGSVRNRAIDHLRVKMREAKYWQYYKDFMPTHSSDTEETVTFNELNNTIETIISTLPEKSQQVFRLNRLEGRSVSEIAKFLQLSERTIEYHLTKSLRQIRGHLKDMILFLVAVWLFL